MVHFSYCFCLTLMHSLWQAALLFLLYLGFDTAIKKNNPVIKRNILFSLLLGQLVLSVSTFYIYYSGAVSLYADLIEANFSGLLRSQPFIEKLAPWLITMYGLVLIIKSVYLIITWIHFKTSSRASWIRPSIDLKLFTAVKSFQFGIRRKVTLWYSNTISTPMTFGFFKPVILLPVALLNNLSLEETETLIIHELTHIKNNDYFLNWMLVACETIFFFNPLIKIIGNRIRLEREKNCDTQVLQFNYPAISYAETLLKTAVLKTSPAPFFLPAAIKNTQLLKRIQFFTKENNLQFYKRNYTAIAILPIVMLFLLNTFLLNFTQQQETSIAAEPVTTASAGSGNENHTNQVSAIAIQPDEKSIALAKEAYKIAEKEKAHALVMKRIAELAAQQVPIPDEAEAAPENIAMPASVLETDDTKEVTLKQESSATGRSVTKVYKMQFINGEWKTRLLWTITERRPGNDSCIIVKDTTHYFNPVQ